MILRIADEVSHDPSLIYQLLYGSLDSGRHTVPRISAVNRFGEFTFRRYSRLVHRVWLSRRSEVTAINPDTCKYPIAKMGVGLLRALDC